MAVRTMARQDSVRRWSPCRPSFDCAEAICETLGVPHHDNLGPPRYIVSINDLGYATLYQDTDELRNEIRTAGLPPCTYLAGKGSDVNPLVTPRHERGDEDLRANCGCVPGGAASWLERPLNLLGRPLVVTRHVALLSLLSEQGLGIHPKDADVLRHATEDDVRDRDVYGVLPLHLAALARTVTTPMLEIPQEWRGRELSLAELRECFRGLKRYCVSDVTE